MEYRRKVGLAHVLAALVMLALAAPMAQAASPKKRSQKRARVRKDKPWEFSRKLSRRVFRHTADGADVVEYPGLLLTRKRGKKIETLVVLADCSEGQICMYLPDLGATCADDAHWAYVAPQTQGDFYRWKACGE